MMRNGLLLAALAAMILGSVKTASADLLYDMETAGAQGPDGFNANGFPSPVITQDTIGLTQGSNSLKFDVPANGGFVGALTTVVPAALGNPPGVDSILFDLTIDANDEFTGAFADIGVTIFETGGIPHQFADFENIGGKAPGLYPDVKIDLDNSGGQSFNDIFASSAVSGLQLFISKSSDAPVTVYIDNIRSFAVPEPASGALLCCGALAIGLLRRRQS